MKISWLRIPGRLKALKQLRTPGDCWLLARALVIAALVPVLFRFRLSTISRWLERRTRHVSRVSDAAGIESIIRCVELAMILGRPLVRPKCLTRTITLYYFLRPTGLNLSVCFGATLKNGQLEPVPGHCWLLKDGLPFLEADDPAGRFIPIYTLPNPLCRNVSAAPASC